MDIDSKPSEDGAFVYTVKLTLEDVAAYPNAIAVLDRATTCAEMLMGLAIIALEMQQKQGEFQAGLREASVRKAQRGGEVFGVDYCQPTRTNPLGQQRRTGQERRIFQAIIHHVEMRKGERRSCQLDESRGRDLRVATSDRRSNIVRRQDEGSVIAGPDQRAAFGPLSRRSGGDRRGYVVMVSGSGGA